MQTLKVLREEAGISRAEVAKALNVSYSTYANYEQGIRRINIEQVLILSKLYGLSEKEIIKSQLNSCRYAR